MYLSSTRFRTRGSRLNPGIWRPELSIFLATASGPMLVVMIQNLANMIEPMTMTPKYVITRIII